MEVKERLRMCKLLEEMVENPEYATILKIKNVSEFNGKSYSEYKNVCTSKSKANRRVD